MARGKPEHSSKVHPGLDRKPGKSNWVDKVGGLPDFIERVAKHIHADSGYTISRAIAEAVAQCKKWCAAGNAKACAAIKQWEAKKARARAELTIVRGRKLSDLEFAELITSDFISLASASNRNSGVSGTGKAFDETKYARNPLTGMFGNKFSASQLIAARRTVEGSLSNLQPGQVFELPGRVGWVKRNADGSYMIQGGAGVRIITPHLSEAVQAAASLIAGKLQELGGKKDA